MGRTGPDFCFVYCSLEQGKAVLPEVVRGSAPQAPTPEVYNQSQSQGDTSGCAGCSCLHICFSTWTLSSHPQLSCVHRRTRWQKAILGADTPPPKPGGSKQTPSSMLHWVYLQPLISDKGLALPCTSHLPICKEANNIGTPASRSDNPTSPTNTTRRECPAPETSPLMQLAVILTQAC